MKHAFNLSRAPISGPVFVMSNLFVTPLPAGKAQERAGDVEKMGCSL
jgi:hypothetical protein